MTDGLFTQDLDGDLVVLDEATQQAHLLTGDAAAQWAELGSDRRTFLRQAGTVAVAGTVITIGLPLASAAASGTAPVPPSATLSGPATATSNQIVTMHLLVEPTTPGNPTPTGSAKLYLRRAAGDEWIPPETNLSPQGLVTFVITVPETGPAAYVAKYHSTHYAYTDTESNLLTVTIVPTKATTAALSGPSAATAGGPPMTFTVSVADADNGVPDGKVTLLANSVAVPGNVDVHLTLGSATFSVPVPRAGTTTAYVAHFTPTFPDMFSACDSNTVSTTVVASPLT